MPLTFDFKVPRILRSATVASLLATPLLAEAPDLPRAGACEHRQAITDDFAFSTTLDWRDDEAVINVRSNKISGRVVGLRPHGQGFKFSVLYTDAIIGETEMVVFAVPETDPTRYRMGSVTYETLSDGTRVIKSTTAFDDITCAVIY